MPIPPSAGETESLMAYGPQLLWTSLHADTLLLGKPLAPTRFSGWMDVSYDSAPGHTLPFPSTFQARRLRLFDSKAIAKYLKYYEKTVRAQRLIPRQIALRKSLQYGVPLTPVQAQEAEAMDVIRTRAMLAAESKCRKLRKGAVAFSLTTESPRRRVHFWILAIKRHQYGRVNPALWNRTKTRAKISESSSWIPSPSRIVPAYFVPRNNAS
jgi:hypothetical protein